MHHHRILIRTVVFGAAALAAQAAAIRLDALASAASGNVSQETMYNSPFVFGGTGTTERQVFPQGCACTFSVTHGGLNDNTGNAVAGFESSTASIGFSYGGATGSAYAAASLPGGWVRVGAGGDYLDHQPSPNSGQDGGTGNAWAQYNDTLHFSVAGANAGTVTLLGISYQLDGSFLISTAAGDSNGSVDNLFQFGSASLRDIITSGPSAYTPAITSTTTAGWVSSSFLSNTPNLIQFQGVYQIVGVSADINITATVDAQCGLGTGCDYQHTAQFGFTSIPGNVTYTSDSGVFLTAATPEPAPVVLLALGLAAIGWRRRAR